MRAIEFLINSDEEHRAALNQTGFWGKQGAGCLFLAKDTGRICIAHRSQAVEQPGTWGTWGGAIDSGEDPVKAIRREVKEEAGYTGQLDLIPLFIFSHPSGFKYYNFLALVDKEFTPITDWETQNSAWFDYGRWPKPLHPGLVTLLSDLASTAIIQKYARAKTKKVKQQFEARPDKTAMKSIERHYSKYKDNDHEAISDYTSGEGSFDSNSQYLNKPLYKAKGAVPKEIKSWTDRTDALVARHRTPNDMTAYYGISRNPKLFSYGSNLIKNNKTTITAPFVFVNHGYTSTSLDPDIAWTFARNQLIDSSNKLVIQAHMLIIKIPKGFSGAYVGHLSAQKDRYGGRWDEMELILPRGTSFTISPKPSVIKKIVRGTTLYVFKWKATAVPPLPLAEGLTSNTIHKLADRKGVKWDDEPSFLQLTKRLTGKEHLDDLDKTGLNKVKRHLDGLQGVAEELDEEFDLIENIIENLAKNNGVDAETIWEDLESLSDDELYVFATTTTITESEAWQKANKKDKTDGMSQKAVNSYRRAHPGSKLKTAVTTKPGKLKKGSKASKRRKSYCSRSRGQMKMHSISCAKTPDKAICKARRRWNC